MINLKTKVNKAPSTRLQALQQRLGYSFSDEKLLIRALTHRSVTAKNNERLEFLGDSILNFVIANALYQLMPIANEGELSRYRATLVREETLADIALAFQLSDHLILGVGELKSGGFNRKSILADAVEAIIAAIYLDAGFDRCNSLVAKWFTDRLDQVIAKKIQKDFKSTLQEYLQAQRFPLPCYEITATTGDAHAQMFYVLCRVEGFAEISRGVGLCRRYAEQAAAEQFLKEVLKLS